MSWYGLWDGFDEDLQNAPDIFARKPQTNYDRIISTPEELAEFLAKSRGGCRALTTKSYVCDFYDDDLNTDCKACWLDWLKQEAQ